MAESYDIAIIGCGPAGLAAAINSKIRNKKTLFLGLDLCSIKMHKSPFIFNYLGFPKVKGEELRQAFLKHAASHGITLTTKKVDAVYDTGDELKLVCGKDEYGAKAVIIATGIDYGQAIKGENEFLGKGVGYCATCDAPLYEGKTVAVIGYSKEGEEEARFLAGVCQKVYYVPMYDQTVTLPGSIQVVKEKPVEITGSEMVNNLTLEKSRLAVDGVFVIKQIVPPAQLVPGLEMDGPHITVDRNMMTNVKGVFAAGDCAGKPYQLSKAAGEGQIAALHAVGYIDRLAAKEPVPV